MNQQQTDALIATFVEMEENFQKKYYLTITAGISTLEENLEKFGNLFSLGNVAAEIDNNVDILPRNKQLLRNRIFKIMKKLTSSKQKDAFELGFNVGNMPDKGREIFKKMKEDGLIV